MRCMTGPGLNGMAGPQPASTWKQCGKEGKAQWCLDNGVSKLVGDNVDICTEAIKFGIQAYPLCLLVREGNRGSLSSKAASLALQLQPLTPSRRKTLDKRAEPMVAQAGLAKASKTKRLDKSLPSLDKRQRLPCCSTFGKKVAPIGKKP